MSPACAPAVVPAGEIPTAKHATNGDDGSAIERRTCMRDVREDLAWAVASGEVTPWTE
jgi:hypothetical protein